HRGHDPENRPRRPNRRPGRQGGGEEGAGEAAGKVHHRRPREAEGVLAGHAHHIQHQAVADQVIPAGVQEGGALEAPPLARQHAVAHQGARLHDAFTARERPGGELPSEQRHVRGDEQEDEGRGGPHAALEIDAAVGPRREHVARDDDRFFPLVAHRRSPASSITPSASATRRSRTRAPSALRSRTCRLADKPAPTAIKATMAPIAASATRTSSNGVPLAMSASIPNPTPTTPAATSAASSAPTLRSRCAGRSTNTIFFPCSSATSYFSEIRSSCCRR